MPVSATWNTKPPTGSHQTESETLPPADPLVAEIETKLKTKGKRHLNKNKLTVLGTLIGAITKREPIFTVDFRFGWILTIRVMG